MRDTCHRSRRRTLMHERSDMHERAQVEGCVRAAFITFQFQLFPVDGIVVGSATISSQHPITGLSDLSDGLTMHRRVGSTPFGQTSVSTCSQSTNSEGTPQAWTRVACGGLQAANTVR